MSTNEENHSPDYLPIAAEDLVKLGIESQLIPFIISAAQWVERWPNDSLSPMENLVEILDAVRYHPNIPTPHTK